MQCLVLCVEPQLDNVVDGDVGGVQLHVDGLGDGEHVARPVGLLLLVPVPFPGVGGGSVGRGGVDDLPGREVGELPELLVVRVDVADEAGAPGGNSIAFFDLKNSPNIGPKTGPR